MATPLPSADPLETAAAVARCAAVIFAVRTAGWERALLSCHFASPDQPAVVTALLAAFLTAPDGAPLESLELWNLPVSTRHLALVRIAAMLEGTDTLTLRLRCPHVGCRELLEAPLALAALTAVHDEHAAQETLAFVPATSASLRVRRPTGEDLRRWRVAGPADESAAQRAMLCDLVLGGEVPENIAPIADAFQSFDPLVAFVFTTTCPACQRSAEHALDLEELALARLREQHTRLLGDINQLARAYGWTEPEILAVPTARRARYLERIGAEPAP
jgi:hypothetical protein